MNKGWKHLEKMKDIFPEDGATGFHAFQGWAAHSAQPVA